MKIKATLLAAWLGTSSLGAATLGAPTAVQTSPDPAAPVITVLKAGSEAPAAAEGSGSVPDGWSAVRLPGPFEGWVKNKDLTKQLDITPGASVLLAPKDGAGVLAVFAKGDKAEITGLRSGWVQVKLDKELVGFIHEAPSAASAPAGPMAAPAPAAAPAQAAAAQPAPPPAADASPVALSKLYEGTLATTHSLLSPHQPYDWQLVDSSNRRIAYVDLSKLLLTDQIENYAGHGVVVLGALKPVPDSPELVIAADGLRLK
jgi:pyruvate/2-oxoglutarate dehydrogenase complex dihydrolipoamide acyltransferase (E2) component